MSINVKRIEKSGKYVQKMCKKLRKKHKKMSKNLGNV